MARVNAQEFAEKWARRTKGATDDYRRGINRVNESPGEKAAARADAYEEGVRRSLAEGKWQRRVASVPLATWKQKALNKGAGRISAGVDEAETDVAQFAGELLNHVDSGLGQLDSTPRGDLETNINRMVTWTRHMSGFRRT